MCLESETLIPGLPDMTQVSKMAERDTETTGQGRRGAAKYYCAGAGDFHVAVSAESRSETPGQFRVSKNAF